MVDITEIHIMHLIHTHTHSRSQNQTAEQKHPLHNTTTVRAEVQHSCPTHLLLLSVSCHSLSHHKCNLVIYHQFIVLLLWRRVGEGGGREGRERRGGEERERRERGREKRWMNNYTFPYLYSSSLS